MRELQHGGASPRPKFHFGPYQFEVRSGELTKHGSKIRLQEQPSQILNMLLQRPGDIVLREEIRQNLWPNDTVVEFDHSINAAIKRLRDALGDSAEDARYVETVARRGYRFIGKLETPLAPQPIRPEPKEETPLGVTPPPMSKPKPKRIMQRAGIIATAVTISGGALLIFAFMSRQPLPDRPRLLFSLQPPDSTAFTNLYGGAAISPDGKLLAFTAMRSGALKATLWLRPVDSLNARELPGTEGANTPFWSPDSQWIAFFTDAKLKKILVSDGTPQLVCDAAAWHWDSGSWGRDGTIVFSSKGVLHRVSANGGSSRPLTRLDTARQESSHAGPHFLPDGHRLLFLVLSRDQNASGLYETSVDHPEERVRIVGTNAKAAYVSPRNGIPPYLLWVRDRTLVAQPFNTEQLLLSGSPLPIVENIAASSVGDAAFWVSETGLLVYRSGAAEKTRMVWIGRDGADLGVIGKEEVFGVPRISPDGSRVALRSRTDSGNTDIWIYEFRSDTLTRLTFDPGVETFPAWSPDGQQVAFTCGGQLCRTSVNGVGPTERLTTATNARRLLDWSRDNQYLLYAEVDVQTRGDLWILELPSTRNATPFLRTHFNELYGQFSPDTKWIAHTSDESGREEVYVRRFSNSGVKRQISNNGGTQPRWGRDGKELFYLAGGNMMSAKIHLNGESLESDSPQVLFPITTIGGTSYSFDVSTDANRFLLLQPVGGGGTAALTVLSNW